MSNKKSLSYWLSSKKGIYCLKHRVKEASCITYYVEGLSLGDSAGRADTLACTAVDAGSFINLVLGLTLRDCTNRTLTNTATAAYAGITNFASHNSSSL